MRGTGGRVCGGYLFAFAPVMLPWYMCIVVLMLFQEINKHSYDRLCVLYLYLYEVLGPGREDMSGQWSVWCSHLLKKNYAVGL